MNPTIELMAAHRSIRKFTDEPVDKQVLTEIIRAAQCASTSNYVQAYTIINVTDQAARKEMADLAGGQVWVEKAPVFLVFCADMNRLARACQAHGKQIACNRSHPPLVPTLRRGNLIFAKAALILCFMVQRSPFPRRSAGTRSGGGVNGYDRIRLHGAVYRRHGGRRHYRPKHHAGG